MRGPTLREGGTLEGARGLVEGPAAFIATLEVDGVKDGPAGLLLNGCPTLGEGCGGFCP